MDALQNIIKALLDSLGLTVYEDGSGILGCIFPDWGCGD